MIFFPLHIGDWAKSTMHLSHEERGIYHSLLIRYYDTEQPLPADRAAIYRLLCVRNADAMQAVDSVLDEFFYLEDDGHHNKRADEEIARFHEKSDKARDAAKARWSGKSKTSDTKQDESEGNADAMRTHSEGNAIHYPLSNIHDPKKESTKTADKPAKRNHAIPANWKPNDGHSEMAAKAGLSVPDEQVRFTDYHLAKGSTMKDWDAAFRTWLRRAAEYKDKNKQAETKKPKAFPGVGQ